MPSPSRGSRATRSANAARHQAGTSSTGISVKLRNTRLRCSGSGSRVVSSKLFVCASKRAQGDLRLEPRQVRAQAVVRAEAEREVAVLLARDVEALGLAEHRLVAVRRAEPRRSPSRPRAPSRRTAPRRGWRGADRAARATRSAAPPRSRTARARARGAGARARRGARAASARCSRSVSWWSRCPRRASRISICSSSSKESFEPSSSACERPVSRSSRGSARRSSTSRRKYSPSSSTIARLRSSVSRLGGANRPDAERLDQLVRPVLEARVVLGRHADDLGDDGDRQRIGQRLHQIDVAASRARRRAAASAISIMRGSSRRMIFGVNAWFTRPRSRSCSGGSVPSMLGGRVR